MLQNLRSRVGNLGTTHTKAGTYIDTWTFIDITGNYYNANGTVVDTIKRALLTISAQTNTKTFDGGTSAGVSLSRVC